MKVGTVTTVGGSVTGTVGAATGGGSSEPQAVSASTASTTGARKILTRRLLVVVPRVVMPRRVVLGVGVIMPVIMTVIARMNRMVVAERDAFEDAGRTADAFGLPKGHVVRRIAFKDEIR